MIRALLLDFDGVPRIWNRTNEARAEPRAGLPAGAILRTAFDPMLLLPAITGREPDEIWRWKIADQLLSVSPDTSTKAFHNCCPN